MGCVEMVLAQTPKLYSGDKESSAFLYLQNPTLTQNYSSNKTIPNTKSLRVSVLSSLHLLRMVEGNPSCSFLPQNGNLPPTPDATETLQYDKLNFSTQPLLHPLQTGPSSE